VYPVLAVSLCCVFVLFFFLCTQCCRCLCVVF
jgi:hypothetical protein